MSRATSSSPADQSGPATGVEALDELSARLLAGAPALRLGVARAGPELEAVYRLRYRHVVERGWARAEDFDDGLERDAHDDHAVHIAAWEAGTLVGTVRLVLPAGGRQLPVEESFGVALEPHGAVVEVGRLLIAPSHRGDPSHRAWGALFARAWLETRARGFSVLGGAASTGLIDLLRALGLPFEILGPAREHWGEQRHPVRLDPSANHRPRWF